MTALTDWLFDKTPDIADDAPPSRFQDGHPTLSNEEEWLEPPADSYTLEEVFTVMDYTDAEGEPSRRRITMRKLARGPHAPILSAICHERRAFRQFRCDRIEAFIDPDTGEVMDCTGFFREVMFIDLTTLAPKVKPAPTPPAPARPKYESAWGPRPVDAWDTSESTLDRARRLRDKWRAPLSVLVALAKSDDVFEPSELDAICRFFEGVEPEVLSQPNVGRISAQTDMRNTIARMRPTRSALYGYMHEVRAACHSAAFREAFETAVNDVLMADGKISPGEQVLLADLGFLADEDG